LATESFTEERGQPARSSDETFQAVSGEAKAHIFRRRCSNTTAAAKVRRKPLRLSISNGNLHVDSIRSLPNYSSVNTVNSRTVYHQSPDFMLKTPTSMVTSIGDDTTIMQRGTNPLSMGNGHRGLLLDCWRVVLGRGRGSSSRQCSSMGNHSSQFLHRTPTLVLTTPAYSSEQCEGGGGKLPALRTQSSRSWHEAIRQQRWFWRRVTGALRGSISSRRYQRNRKDMQGQGHQQHHRPSRQLVKKASKQMKREQKATVTLAIVLGRCRSCGREDGIGAMTVISLQWSSSAAGCPSSRCISRMRCAC